MRSPVIAFLAVALVVLATMAVITNRASEKAAEDLGITSRIDINRLLARSILQPKIRDRLVAGSPVALDNVDQRALKAGGNVVQLNIFDQTGRVVYSRDIQKVGQEVRLSAGERAVLAHGGTGYEPVDAEEADVRLGDVPPGGLVQIYTRLRTREEGYLLFEGYYRLDDITARRTEILSVFRFNTLAPLVLMTLIAAGMLQLLTRQVRRAARDRERLLRTAIEASDAERRRIARDLHDGVVQDIAGTTFTLSGLARDPAVPAASRAVLDGASSSLRDGLKALRSLLAEIHPPDLHAEGLAAAMQDLIAPAGGAGIQASVSVAGTDGLSDEHAALIWRVAQEAVRNALRHSGASTLAVTVRGDGRRVVLEVVDDGVGFDASRPAAADSFGLRGLRSLVGEAAGSLDVRSSPGEGTRVRMEVDAR